MSETMRCVFDTNALVSAVLFADSRPGQAFRHALRRGQLLVSTSTMEELAEVLQRAKFARYVTPRQREEFLAALVERSLVVERTEEIRLCRDAKDDKFLELAVGGGASYIVTGDSDLLALHPFRQIAILTPTQFLEAIGEEPPEKKT